MPSCEPGSSKEKFIGTIVSIVVGGIAFAVLFIFEILGISTESAVVYTSIISNFVGYTGDILIAKQCFDEWEPIGEPSWFNDKGKYVPVQYDQWDVEKRFIWYIKSLASKSFIRFLLITVIDTLVSLAIIDLVIRSLEKANINFKFRNSVIAVLVSILVFQVFVNDLRFRFAYTRSQNLTDDILLFTWASLALLIYIVIRKLTDLESHRSKSAVDIS
jgi:hypothetical protein